VNTITLRIVAEALNDNLHPQDEDVAGVYETLVPADIPLEDAAETALEAFHEKTGIKVLENYDICVEDLQGKMLTPSGNRDIYFSTSDIWRVQ
jgi:hypothetical protein